MLAVSACPVKASLVVIEQRVEIGPKQGRPSRSAPADGTAGASSISWRLRHGLPGGFAANYTWFSRAAGGWNK